MYINNTTVALSVHQFHNLCQQDMDMHKAALHGNIAKQHMAISCGTADVVDSDYLE